METSVMCQDMPAGDKSMVMLDTMEHADLAPTDDCCLVDVMPECCDTCQLGSVTIPTPLTFHINTSTAIQTIAVIPQPPSITQPPLLRPPVIS